MKFHAGLANSGIIPSEFRFLNTGLPYRVGFDPQSSSGYYNQFLHILDGNPAGGTPLCKHIYEIIAAIRHQENYLRANNQKAVVIIATDGQPTDGDIVNALNGLKSLPAWVILRLCTNDETVVEYWNGVENNLELSMDVLDDYLSEGVEVAKANSWLTYGEPIHRMREFGIGLVEFDKLDETLLSADELLKLCKLM